jgi:hypothetical protein
MTFPRILVLTLLLSLTACSSQQLYEATQPKYTDTECANMPETEFQDCIAREPMSYEEYQRERGAADEEG